MHVLASAFVSEFRILRRQFQKAPLTFLSLIAVLALGIGGTTAVFSALYAVALRPLPYPKAQELVVVHSQFPRLQMNRLGVSPLDYLDLRKMHHVFSDAGAFFFLDLSRTGIDHAEKVNAVATTTSMFETLRVRPKFGRYFSVSEERIGVRHVVILSDAYWKTAFGGDTGVLNKVIQLNGEPYSVIGVMPPSFVFPNDATQMWVPTVFKPEWLGHLGRQNVFLHMYARLADGITFDQASKELEVISHRAAISNRGEYSVDLTGWRYFLVPLSKENNSSVQTWAWVLFWSVLVLFLIVCLNASGLFILRAMHRSFEISVRLALGAGIPRIARHAMFEAVVVCVVAALAAVFTAVAGVRLLTRSGEFGEPGVSLPVLGFGVMVTLLAGTFCAAYPVWRAIRTDPADVLNSAENRHTHSHTRQYVRRTLLVIQIAAATALLITGGLLLHTYTRLLATPLGFDADRITTMQVSLPPLRYSSDSARRTFYETVVDRIRHLPGISDASACTVVPFGYGENMQPFALSNAPPTAAQQLAAVNAVLPGFFETLRIPLVAGRYIDSSDVPGHEYTVVIDRNLAHRYFPRQNPIGRQLRMGARRFSIVGIVGDIKSGGLDALEPPMLYLSGLQMPTTDMSILVKASHITQHVPKLVQSIVASIDRDQPVYDVASLQRRIDASLSTRRFVVFLLTAFSAIAIATTAIGLYGALSYSALLRSREFGIRSALGATPQNLGILIFRSGMSLVLAGFIFGSITAISVAHYLSAELYDVRVGDMLTWLSTTSMVLGIGVLACFPPSWRALNTNVTTMLKHE